ncbi:MAG TPA: FecR domain-containing protein [Myxococcaceae bacterium]|nr:FecR domain-containing protein [Myxococcaceae bacterium]
MSGVLRQLGMTLALAVAPGACTGGGDAGRGAPDRIDGAEVRRPRATLATVTGAVTVKRAAGDSWTSAVEGMDLFENDKVRTARGASAQVRFESGSALTISEDALVGIAEPRPRPVGDGSDVTVLKGRIDAELPNPKDQSLVVATPSATVRAGREIVFQ